MSNSPTVRGTRLEERLTAPMRCLAAKQGEKSRYVKLYAQGLLDDEELEVYLADLRNQVEYLKMLIVSVEADLAAKDRNALVARSTEAWLLTLRENLEEVTQDTEEAFEARRELAKLLVERIRIGRGEDDRARVEITYRFGPPEISLEVAVSADGVRNSEEFSRVHGHGGGEGLLWATPG